MTAHRGSRISARLLTIVLLPMLTLAAFAGRQLIELNRLEGRADVVLEQVDELNRMLVLYVALVDERIASEALAGGIGLGLTLEQTGAFLGFDVADDLTTARERFHVAAASASARDVDTMQLVSPIAALRSTMADDSRPAPPSISDVRAVFDPLQERVSDLVLERVDAIGLGMTALSVSPEAWDDRIAIEQAARAYTMASWQIEWMSALLVPSQDRPADTRLKLQSSTVLYDETIATLPGHLGPRGSAEWSRFSAADIEAAPFERRVRSYLLSDVLTDSTPPSFEEIGQVLRAGIDRNTALRQVLAAAGEDLAATVGEVHDDATTSFRTYLAVSGAVTAGTILLLWQTARSIVRPLRRLEDRAVAVSSGQLHHTPLAPGGPREVRIVTAAFNEAVANLGRVDQVAVALANGELGDDTIASVPGGIGDSLRNAVDRLSQSIRESEELQERLRYQANHDVLTGLYNRRGIEAFLDERAPDAPSVAVLFVDLDGFKGINDTLGHRIGDKVLQIVAQRLEQAVGPDSALARFGGDQWVAVLTDAELVHATSAANAAGANILQPISVESHRITLTVTVGIAFTDQGQAGRTTIRNADLALYEARRTRPGSVRVYDSSLRALLALRRQTERELRTALEHDALEVHYQPVVDAGDRRLRGVEALVRWRLPDGRLRPPSEFVPVAEESDLIIELDRWVLRKAMEEVAQWRTQAALGDLHLAVNISGRHLVAPSFVTSVFDLLDLSRLEPTALTVEITETVLLADLATARIHLDALRARGVKVAIDDFGTGYTSVSHLRTLPADTLKIDRSFISDPGGIEDRALVALVVEVGRTLQLEVVAEGVETDEQLAFVNDTGCHMVQGYLTGRPMTPTAFVDTYLGADAALS